MESGLNQEVKDLLEFKYKEYNSKSFIEHDPISIPHKFSQKEDIEIIGFLVSIIAWGNRKSIINSGNKLIEILGTSPYDFIMEFKEKDLEKINFIHRTFNSIDLKFFLKSLKNIYQNYKGLEYVFSKYSNEDFMFNSILHFRDIFFSINHEKRSEKHISNPKKKSACKRINMFLRWMVRSSRKGVDFGLWKNIDPGQLSCPLDIHSGRVARSLSLIKRKQNDNLALMELDSMLRKFDHKDPVKYDFALFGLSKYEKFY